MVVATYVASVILVVCGIVAVVRAIRRWGRGGSAVCAACGVVMVICGIGVGAAMHAALAARYIVVPLIAGILLLCIEAWVRSGDRA